MAAVAGTTQATADQLAIRFDAVRRRTLDLCQSLAPEDCVVQSMPDVSPTKWHLAHVTWFFETFVLTPRASNYRPYDDSFAHLFNSYYNTAGTMHTRAKRGLITRPTLDTVVAYRAHVDAAVHTLLESDPSDEIAALIELGLQHEQQHQELLLTDILHVLSVNPCEPTMRDDLTPAPETPALALDWHETPGGLIDIGANAGDSDFCYDNETPRHRVLQRNHAIANRAVTNGEYLDFIQDGGYQQSTLWMSDGWSAVQQQDWHAPLYWDNDHTSVFTLGGRQPIDWHAPVCHVSFYEADAFARWAGMRLPTESEWEQQARQHPVQGNFADTDIWRPAAGGTHWFGDVWEWTASPYAAYPGFQPLSGSLGEYNGKFMCNQMVVRGGSCFSAADHLRATYRSFFYPDARWQALGLRLAKDL